MAEGFSAVLLLKNEHVGADKRPPIENSSGYRWHRIPYAPHQTARRRDDEVDDVTAAPAKFLAVNWATDQTNYLFLGHARYLPVVQILIMDEVNC